ncbi:alpha/beta fold hydrolase [Pseudonocardia sp. CA-107938]|uniref:alpha/beta fold hydrolase n=1 Tax=Pseudonocardia sp. CA-107938 TaxID=3240021 RepID=UPI003D8A9139
MAQNQTTVESDVEVPGGATVRIARHGDPHAPIVLCVHGLSANLRAFDYVADRIGGAEHQVVAMDLRGRGQSSITPPGSYGLASHAADVLAVADGLGADRFDLVGWSLGALIGITVAGLAGERLRTLTLIDHAREEEPAVHAAVRAGLGRLDAVVGDPADYVATLRTAGHVAQWSHYWDRLYAYELHATGDGWRPRTSKAACTEDLDRLADERAGLVANWSRITMPALLVRAAVPFAGGDTVTAADRDALRAAAADLRVVEVPQNHFGVMTDERTADAVGQLLMRRRTP